MLTLSQCDRDRLFVLRQLGEGALSIPQAARRLRLGNRHTRRLLRAFEKHGDEAVVHGLRGRASNHRLPDALREAVREKARDPLYKGFGPTLLSEHLEREGMIVPRSTLRLWMIEDELWKPSTRKKRHRTRRERRAAYGELVLMDSSIHAWLEDRCAEPIVLIAMIDDATNRLFARFVPKDTGAANRQMILDYMECFGRPLALYTDRASHFGNYRRPHGSVKAAEAQDAEMTTSIIRSALEALGCELILAMSPQAKGRVERLFGTLQDRLIKEMRVAGVSALEEANTFLQDVFIPFWEERFTLEAAEPLDAHLPLREDVALQCLFAETEERTIANDFTIRYKSQYFQIGAEEAGACMPKQRLVVERRLDGSLRFRFRDRYLKASLLRQRDARHPEIEGPSTPPPAEIGPQNSIPAPASGSQAPAESSSASTAGRRPQRAPHKPAADHPWRRYPIRIALLRSVPPPVEASASLRPDSPEREDALCTP